MGSATPAPRTIAARCSRRRRTASRGQALVELTLVIPLMLALLLMAFGVYNGLRSAVALTGAARDGVITAASNLKGGRTQCQALTNATTAVNEEEGVTLYSASDGSCGYVCSSNCVSLSQSIGTRTGQTIWVIKVTRTITVPVPLVPGYTISTSAGAEQ